MNKTITISAVLILTLFINCASGKNPKESKVAEENTKMRTANHLLNEKSPYLLQHAYNPVDWYPWGDEAFAKAKKEDKPIFLSIGYSTCHWCHVMAHESFENEDIAHLLNKSFVCIKVDREERPDIDNVYMKVCQMMTGSGGWPLTIIMTPDKKPFFAGTYIPPESRQGRMGLPDLTKAVNVAWKSERNKIDESVEKIFASLNRETSSPQSHSSLEKTPDMAFDWFRKRFDSQNGGFGGAPKFPSPHNLIFLLRYGFFHKDAAAKEMVFKTLEKMRYGGIYDHIGYGFHRYSTDKQWKLPHFEKMLYDQALLLYAYSEAWLNLPEADPRKELFAKTAEEISQYIKRDMTNNQGGFYSAEDADSEGEEGKFYVWSMEELRNLLDKSELELVINYFNMDEQGNFHEEASRKKTGDNILFATENMHVFAINKKLQSNRWPVIRKKMFDYRENRVHPGKDDKILTDWNGLMIGALAYAARVFNNQEMLKMSKNAASFLLSEMTHKNGRLLHRYHNGEKSIPGFLDDYAFFTWGMLELYAASSDVKYLSLSIEFNHKTNELFWDSDKDGYLFSGSDNETLITETKDLYDGAIPSGNSVMINNLFRLFHLTGDQQYSEKFEQMKTLFSSDLSSQPGAYTHFLTAILQQRFPSKELVIVSDQKAERVVFEKIKNIYQPNLFYLFKTEENKDELAQIAPFTEFQNHSGSTTYFLCENHTCQLPINKLSEITKSIARELK